jgi:hypothetical protein
MPYPQHTANLDCVKGGTTYFLEGGKAGGLGGNVDYLPPSGRERPASCVK